MASALDTGSDDSCWEVHGAGRTCSPAQHTHHLWDTGGTPCVCWNSGHDTLPHDRPVTAGCRDNTSPARPASPCQLPSEGYTDRDHSITRVVGCRSQATGLVTWLLMLVWVTAWQSRRGRTEWLQPATRGRYHGG